MKKHILLLLMLCAVLFAAHNAAADTISCNNTADVFIDQYAPTTNFNDKTRLLISYHPTRA